jgi:hypothetical protein
MSTAILDVWITNLGDPCSIASDVRLPHAWVVAVFGCSGRVVNWSEARFRFRKDDPWTQVPLHTPPGGVPGTWLDSVPTRDGHVEIEVPPGCYVVRATMHSWFVNGQLYGNWATDRAVVQACCGEDVCATLYAPTAPACSIPLFEFVIPLLKQHGIIGQEQSATLARALGAALGEEKASEYERGELQALRMMFGQMETGKGTRRRRKS